MRPRLWARLLTSHVVVVLVAGASILLAVSLVAPAVFESAMGHSGGMAGMGEMMTTLVRSAFQEALGTALAVAAAVALGTAVIVSIYLSARISRPIGQLAAASRRIESGRYSERVMVSSTDEVGELAESFNKMAASLEATEQRRLELVGDVAHELRTPLSTLDGYLEGLEDGVVKPGAETWRVLRGETARLSRLVGDLQELWRAEAGQLHLTSKAVDVADQLKAAADRFAAQARQRGVEILVEIVPLGLVVPADGARLGQIIDNFLSNAVHFSPSGGTVTVSARSSVNEVAIEVADQGPGLTQEQLSRVFERFYRVDPARSRALGGSGIGLAIARALAEAMGARVEASSAGAGLGSAFRVVLPTA